MFSLYPEEDNLFVRVQTKTNTVQKMKFSIKKFFSNWGFRHISEEILNEKLHFLCS